MNPMMICIVLYSLGVLFGLLVFSVFYGSLSCVFMDLFVCLFFNIVFQFWFVCFLLQLLLFAYLLSKERGKDRACSCVCEEMGKI